MTPWVDLPVVPGMGLELSLYPGRDVYRPGLKSQAYPKKRTQQKLLPCW